MAAKVSIYHNPRCSKSRQALEILRQRGIEPEIIQYLEAPPSAAELERLLALLGVEPHALLRSKEAAYAEFGLSKDSSLSEVARAIGAQPILLERPLVVAGGKAVIGRPPERVLEIL